MISETVNESCLLRFAIHDIRSKPEGLAEDY